MGRERDRHQPHHHRNRQHDAEVRRIEPLGGEPDRQERHLHAEHDEQGRIESGHSPRKSRACGRLGMS
jgi:hypothetical protein